ncbi:hypothetical protein SK128_026298, partial [Halocaridina rubra]
SDISSRPASSSKNPVRNTSEILSLLKKKSSCSGDKDDNSDLKPSYSPGCITLCEETARYNALNVCVKK